MRRETGGGEGLSSAARGSAKRLRNSYQIVQKKTKAHNLLFADSFTKLSAPGRKNYSKNQLVAGSEKQFRAPPHTSLSAFNPEFRLSLFVYPRENLSFSFLIKVDLLSQLRQSD